MWNFGTTIGPLEENLNSELEKSYWHIMRYLNQFRITESKLSSQIKHCEHRVISIKNPAIINAACFVTNKDIQRELDVAIGVICNDSKDTQIPQP